MKKMVLTLALTTPMHCRARTLLPAQWSEVTGSVSTSARELVVRCKMTNGQELKLGGLSNLFSCASPYHTRIHTHTHHSVLSLSSLCLLSIHSPFFSLSSLSIHFLSCLFILYPLSLSIYPSSLLLLLLFSSYLCLCCCIWLGGCCPAVVVVVAVVVLLLIVADSLLAWFRML